jgi:hypothetical protein
MAMEEFDLGPNGGLIYCMEYLLNHIDWLEEKISKLEESGIKYIIFDCPGQIELYTHHTSVQDIIRYLSKRNVRLTSVFLIDSYCCCDPSTFISAILLVGTAMLRLGLPHVNVLTKIDLLSMYGPLAFNIDFYLECTDLSRLVRYIDGPAYTYKDNINDDSDSDSDSDNNKDINSINNNKTTIMSRRKKMTENICDLLSDIGLVTFLPLNIQDGLTVGRVLSSIDIANGYSFTVSEAKILHNDNDILGSSEQLRIYNEKQQLFKNEFTSDQYGELWNIMETFRGESNEIVEKEIPI